MIWVIAPGVSPSFWASAIRVGIAPVSSNRCQRRALTIGCSISGALAGTVRTLASSRIV